MRSTGPGSAKPAVAGDQACRAPIRSTARIRRPRIRRRRGRARIAGARVGGRRSFCVAASATSNSTISAPPRKNRVDARIDVARAERRRDRPSRSVLSVCLAEMQREDPLRASASRDDGHHGMPVDAIGLALIGGEKMAERGIALQLRRADDERDRSPARRAVGRCRSRGRCCRSSGWNRMSSKPCSDRSPAPRLFNQANAGVRCSSIHAGVSLRLEPASPIARTSGNFARCAGVGRLREQNRRHAARRQRLHDVGRAGEIVAVIGEQQFRHRRSSSRRHSWPPPNLAMRLREFAMFAGVDFQAECRRPPPPRPVAPPARRPRGRRDG